MPDALLTIENLSKHFGGVRAVNNVSFAVNEGVIKAIIGPNGAGKTTLFNLIAGSLHPNTGNVYLENRNVTRFSDHQMVRIGVARTFQNTRIFTNMTVLENAMMGRHSRSKAGFVSTALRLPWMIREEYAIMKAACESLEFVGLGDLQDALADALPFKQQRLLEFARALAIGPKVLLADEPAAGLNARETKEIASLIKKINDTGITVLLVEHDMSLVMDISEEILVLDFGSKIAEGNPSDIRQNQDVIDVYLGRRAEDA
jgi:branched-chain amino acid transport system ATP-binding protein